MLVDEGVGVGWTIYVPLVCEDFHGGRGVEVAIFGVHMIGLSSVSGGSNLLTP